MDVRKEIEPEEKGTDTTSGIAQDAHQGSLRLEDLISEKGDGADDAVEADLVEAVRDEASRLELTTPAISAYQTQSRNIIT